MPIPAGNTDNVTWYCTLDQLKTELGIDNTDDDGRLELSIAAASRQFDGWCGWRFWQDTVAQTRTFYADDNRTVSLIDDEAGDGIATTTGLVVKVDTDGDGTYETTVTVNTDFVLEPANAASRTPAWPYTELRVVPYSSAAYFPTSYGRPAVQVTATFGWPAVPDDVIKACLIQSAQLFKAKDAAFGVAGFADFGVMRVKSELHPIAKGLLVPYRKPAIG